jgi:alkanesulfonate monooxygenase
VAARRKHEEYLSVADPVGALTLMSGWTGVDFSQLKPDEPVRHVLNDAGRTALENVTRADPDRVWTVGEVARHVAIGGIGPVFVGDAREVADQLEAWVDHAGIDGFNLAFASRPETFESVVDFIVPELQRRGRYQRQYAEGTLREKLFGRTEAPARRATG